MGLKSYKFEVTKVTKVEIFKAEIDKRQIRFKMTIFQISNIHLVMKN
jgi:hypothetical protein